jgi:hypothetical protein
MHRPAVDRRDGLHDIDRHSKAYSDGAHFGW